MEIIPFNTSPVYMYYIKLLYVLAGMYNNPLISLSVIYTYPNELDIMDTTVTTRSASYPDT
jgi:hypothetical protein